jgi:hypothetical protein
MDKIKEYANVGDINGLFLPFCYSEDFKVFYCVSETSMKLVILSQLLKIL